MVIRGILLCGGDMVRTGPATWAAAAERGTGSGASVAVLLLGLAAAPRLDARARVGLLGVEAVLGQDAVLLELLAHLEVGARTPLRLRPDLAAVAVEEEGRRREEDRNAAEDRARHIGAEVREELARKERECGAELCGQGCEQPYNAKQHLSALTALRKMVLLASADAAYIRYESVM